MKIYRKGVKNRRRVVKAEDELDVDDTPMPEGEGDVSVDPEATDLLFEAEDVAQLVAEVTGEDVEVTSTQYNNEASTPVTPVVIETIRVETNGVDYEIPEMLEPFDTSYLYY